jgi:hypothetical protein
MFFGAKRQYLFSLSHRLTGDSFFLDRPETGLKQKRVTTEAVRP